MHRGIRPYLLLFPLSSAIGLTACDDTPLHRQTELGSVEDTERLASGASSLVERIASDAKTKAGSSPLASNVDGYLSIGPDDVVPDGHFGFSLGERVPPAVRDAQRSLIDRMNALYKEWQASGRGPDAFLHMNASDLHSMSRGFMGLEVEPPKGLTERAQAGSTSSVKPFADRPPPPLAVFDSSLQPCDRPAPSTMPLVNCSASRAEVLNGAKDNAAYVVWRTLWLLDRILEEDDATAELLWRDGWAPPHLSDDLHWQLQNWFGDFDRNRAEGLRSAFRALWDRWLGPGADGTYENSAGVLVESALVCYVPPTAAEVIGWVLSGQIWQFFNPCFTGGGSAHHLYASGPQFCGEFFANGGSDQQNGAILIHELLHRVRIDGKLIQDTHPVVCGYDEGDDGLPKCYSTDEVLSLAENFPHIAILNNENYELFSAWYLNHWLSGNCTNPSVCAEVDDTAPGCAPPPPPPPPPDYSNCPDPTDPNQFGNVGCPCKDVDIFAIEDIALDGGSPDGDGSYVTHGSAGPGQFCFGADVVCGSLPGADPNSTNDDFSICKACGDNPDETRAGCPCQTDADCEGVEPGLVCWGSEASGWGPSAGGKCLPDGSAPNHEWHEEHPWFCLDNCESMALGSDVFGCYYDQDLGGLGKAEHGECITLSNTCSNLVVGQCEIENNRQCTDGGGCLDECNLTEECLVKGFPSEYVCDSAGEAGFEPGHCVPPECANNKSPYCSLFR